MAGIETDRLFDAGVPMEEMLPPAFLDQIRHLRHLSLFELVESLIKLFKLEVQLSDFPYLQALQDLVIDLQRREPMGVTDFLAFWEQHGWKQSVSVSEESNAIRILTIHKAKGLEFKAVIVPFCNWEITTDQKKANILWCDTSHTPFSRVPVVPVRFSGQMKHTLFSGSYYRERMQGYMDSLNLLYVAFTRAKDILMLGIPDPDKPSFRHTGDLLKMIIEQELKSSPSEQVIELGSFPSFRSTQPLKDPWIFTTYPVNHGKRSLKVRLRSDEYFLDEESLYNDKQLFGNIMHQLFSRIYSRDDVKPTLEDMQQKGLIRKKDRDELEDIIQEMILQEGVSPWFAGSENRKIYNERSIYCSHGRVIRPDRVIIEDNEITVVDFKFGSLEKDAHMLQVQDYIHHLKQMGYKSAEGYLWYVLLGKTIKVESL